MNQSLFPKPLIVLLLAGVLLGGVLFLVSCIDNQKDGAGKTSVCDVFEPGDSLLCDIASELGVSLESIGNGLIIVNMAAVSQGTYTVAEVKEVIEKLLASLDGSITCALFGDVIQDYTKGYPGLFTLSKPLLDRFSLVKQVMGSADRDILRKFLQARLDELG